MRIAPILASAVEVDDVLTDAEGRYFRTVVSKDTVTNVHGKIIFRTGRNGTGSTVADPGTTLHVVV